MARRGGRRSPGSREVVLAVLPGQGPPVRGRLPPRTRMDRANQRPAGVPFEAVRGRVHRATQVGRTRHEGEDAAPGLLTAGAGPIRRHDPGPRPRAWATPSSRPSTAMRMPTVRAMPTPLARPVLPIGAPPLAARGKPRFLPGTGHRTMRIPVDPRQHPDPPLRIGDDEVVSGMAGPMTDDSGRRPRAIASIDPHPEPSHRSPGLAKGKPPAAEGSLHRPTSDRTG